MHKAIILFFFILNITSIFSDTPTRSCPPCALSGPVAEFCSLLVDSKLCVSGNAQINGNLTVCGAITASGLVGTTGPTGATGAGFSPSGPLHITNTIQSIGFCITGTTGTTGFSGATGALIVDGGVSVGGNLNVAGYINTCQEYRIDNAIVLQDFSADLAMVPLNFDRTLSVGFQAGQAVWPVGTRAANTFVGNLAGQTTNPVAGGGFNTFIGDRAGQYTTSGALNSALGQYALTHCAGGRGNTALGASAGALLTGNFNNCIGYYALRHVLGGSYNNALGCRALHDNVGHYNIGIGHLAGNNLTNGSFNIDISHLGIAGDQGIIRIGNRAQQLGCFIAGIAGITVANSVPVLIDTATDQLGTVPSARQYKQDIVDMPDQTENIMSLRPVNFHYKSDNSQTLQYGLIAEEVAEIYPELVTRDAQGNIYTINYMGLIPLLLSVIQSQDDQLKKLETCPQQIQALSDALIALQQKISHS